MNVDSQVHSTVNISLITLRLLFFNYLRRVELN